MILDEIISRTRRELEVRKTILREETLLQGLDRLGPPRSLSARLSAPHPRGFPVHIIAEIKKASPSCGCIREDFDPVGIARRYDTNGASAVSVVTEEHYFQGGLHVLEAVRSATALPLVRKDFLVDPYQVAESRYFGADAVLLIARALSDRLMELLLTSTRACGMEALVEVHDDRDLERALAAGAAIIGINNRDLATFQTDLATSERLARRVPDHVLLVSESGIRTPEDIRRLAASGIRAFLVGETLMRAPHPGEKLRELLQWYE